MNRDVTPYNAPGELRKLMVERTTVHRQVEMVFYFDGPRVILGHSRLSAVSKAAAMDLDSFGCN